MNIGGVVRLPFFTPLYTLIPPSVMSFSFFFHLSLLPCFFLLFFFTFLSLSRFLSFLSAHPFYLLDCYYTLLHINTTHCPLFIFHLSFISHSFLVFFVFFLTSFHPFVLSFPPLLQLIIAKYNKEENAYLLFYCIYLYIYIYFQIYMLLILFSVTLKCEIFSLKKINKFLHF